MEFFQELKKFLCIIIHAFNITIIRNLLYFFKIKIASIYDVLKDDVKRERYDQILEFGLPDWRQPIYYFRRVRKLNTSELAIAISIIISVGHYFVMWAQYFEKKLTLEDRYRIELTFYLISYCF